MKLCSVCLNSDILCGGCMRKVESGLISGTDVAVSRALNRLADGKARVEFLQAAEHDGKIIIVCEKKYSKPIIGRGGKSVRELSKALGKEVRVIEKADEKTMIENILGSRVIGINIVYGKKETKRIRVDKERRRLRGDAALLGKILGSRYQIVFE